MLMEILVPLGAFAMLAAMVGMLTGVVATGMHHRTIREALKTHPESAPALIASLNARAPWAEPLLGWILLTLAATIAILALFEDAETQRQMLKVAVVPAVLGVVTLAYLRFAHPRIGDGSAG